MRNRAVCHFGRNAVLLAALLSLSAGVGWGKDKSKAPVDANDPTSRLFQLLDSQYDGKLKDFYVLADVYKGAEGADLQHVLRVNYDKDKYFGKLEIYVRSIQKPDEAQLKGYTLKALFEFGEYDLQKFIKTQAGPLGGTGDLYLEAKPGFALAAAPIDEDARKAYDTYVNQFVIPALQKKP